MSGIVIMVVIMIAIAIVLELMMTIMMMLMMSIMHLIRIMISVMILRTDEADAPRGGPLSPLCPTRPLWPRAALAET